MRARRHNVEGTDLTNPTDTAMARSVAMMAGALETNNERLLAIEALLRDALAPREGPSRLELALERLVAVMTEDSAMTQGKLDEILRLLRGGNSNG